MTRFLARATAVAQLSELATGRRHIRHGHTPLGALVFCDLLATLAAIGAPGWMMTPDRFRGY